MQNVRFRGKTHTLGLDQSYHPLHVGVVVVEGEPAMKSVWQPDADELTHILQGGRIVLTILGTIHPPVRIDVEEA